MDKDNPFHKLEQPKLRLLTPKQLLALPDGSIVWNIFNIKKTKGVDEIDMDTRGGYTAWGQWTFSQTGSFWSNSGPPDHIRDLIEIVK